jgi:glycosyltransferase involved in cell wall biosynthesis
MAAGRPVVARRAGGVLDTVVEDVTGVFFDDPTPEALSAAVLKAEAMHWDPAVIRARAERFTRARFEAAFSDYVAGALERDAAQGARRQAGGRHGG